MSDLDITTVFLMGMTTYGPMTLGLAMLLGTLGIPVPLPILAVAAGAFARHGLVRGGLAVFTALAGATLGDSLGYVIGRFASDWAQRHYGDSGAWRKARSRFHRNGDLAIFITRFLLTPLAVPTNLIAGISRYPYRLFFVYTVAGTMVFIIFFGGLGFIFGEQWRIVGEFIDNYFVWLVVATTVGVVMYLVARPLSRYKQRAARRLDSESNK